MEHWYRLYTRFHSKIIGDKLDLKDSILGKARNQGDLAADNDLLTNESVRAEQVNEKLEVISRVTDKIFEEYPYLTLKEIMQGSLPNDPMDNLYRTRFSVLSIAPLNLYETCQ